MYSNDLVPCIPFHSAYQSTPSMTAYGKTRSTLVRHKLAPSKKFGQNFLVHRHTAEAIVQSGNLHPDDIVVEVGVGLAALTLPLAESVRHVFGIEIDSGIVRYHEEEHDLPENVTLLHQDILQADFGKLVQLCGGKLKIMANLPYSISNPFIFKLIDNQDRVETATIMLQKEVANRLLAEPGSKEYGIPTVLLRHCARIRKLMTLGPAEFHPQPKVDSVVIQIQFHNESSSSSYLSPDEFEIFVRIVRSTFSQRRKTILNTLASANLFADTIERSQCKELIEHAIREAGSSPKQRPEELTIQSFEALSRVFYQILRGGDNTTLPSSG